MIASTRAWLRHAAGDRLHDALDARLWCLVAAVLGGFIALCGQPQQGWWMLGSGALIASALVGVRAGWVLGHELPWWGIGVGVAACSLVASGVALTPTGSTSALAFWSALSVVVATTWGVVMQPLWRAPWSAFGAALGLWAPLWVHDTPMGLWSLAALGGGVHWVVGAWWSMEARHAVTHQVRNDGQSQSTAQLSSEVRRRGLESDALREVVLGVEDVVEVALRELSEARGALRRGLDVAEKLKRIEAKLRRACDLVAKVDDEPKQGECVALSEGVRAAIGTALLDADAPQERVQWTTDADALRVQFAGGQASLSVALGGVIAYALRSRSNATVTVEASRPREAEVDRVVVRTNGAPYPRSALNVLREGAIPEATELGLHTARALIQSSGGMLSARNPDEGGHEVKVWLRRCLPG